MRIFSGTTFANTYSDMCDSLLKTPEYQTQPRGMKINEILNAIIEINEPQWNIFYNEVRNIPMQYLAKELALYFSGRCDRDGFIDASSFWKKIIPKHDIVHSAYGNLIFKMRDANGGMTQWDWAKTSLIKDKDSRQAIFHFNRPSHQYTTNKDFVCTLCGIFHIRDNKLDLTIERRSNDIIRGVTFDIPFELLLMQVMLNELKVEYRDLSLGKYTCIVNSLHLYEEHFNLVDDMTNVQFFKGALPQVEQNPILSKEVIEISQNLVYNGNDAFFRWLHDTRKVSS